MISNNERTELAIRSYMWRAELYNLIGNNKNAFSDIDIAIALAQTKKKIFFYQQLT